MNLSIIGATGNIGKRIVAEALGRGHSVRALVRAASMEALPRNEAVVATACDIFDDDSLTAALRPQDVLISAYGPGSDLARFVPGVQAQLAATRKVGVGRFIMVGGAGSLRVAGGIDLLDAPDFPEAYKGIARVHREALQLLRDCADLNWTNVSPSALISAGERTGRYRVGTDELLVDSNGDSAISMEDFAMAILDEVERPRFERQRFTVGY